jgi:hypothetical protein
LNRLTNIQLDRNRAGVSGLLLRRLVPLASEESGSEDSAIVVRLIRYLSESWDQRWPTTELYYLETGYHKLRDLIFVARGQKGNTFEYIRYKINKCEDFVNPCRGNPVNRIELTTDLRDVLKCYDNNQTDPYPALAKLHISRGNLVYTHLPNNLLSFEIYVADKNI